MEQRKLFNSYHTPPAAQRREGDAAGASGTSVHASAGQPCFEGLQNMAVCAERASGVGGGHKKTCLVKGRLWVPD
jgi:hypothetical protein